MNAIEWYKRLDKMTYADVKTMETQNEFTIALWFRSMSDLNKKRTFLGSIGSREEIILRTLEYCRGCLIEYDRRTQKGVVDTYSIDTMLNSLTYRVVRSNPLATRTMLESILFYEDGFRGFTN